MTWEEVRADHTLLALPYKIELNEWGKIEMSPLGYRRREYEREIVRLLQKSKPDGLAMAEPAVRTAENIKVPDAAWISSANDRSEMTTDNPGNTAPEICVELITPNHVWEEKLHKGQLYLQAGAEEFWLCDEQGDMRFFNGAGPMERSALCPDFPSRVILPE